MQVKFHLHLVGVGRNTKLTQTVWGQVGPASLRPPCFFPKVVLDDLRETGSELKLTYFQQKNSQTKRSILAPRLDLIGSRSR